jgi:hypothetical protein
MMLDMVQHEIISTTGVLGFAPFVFSVPSPTVHHDQKLYTNHDSFRGIIF